MTIGINLRKLAVVMLPALSVTANAAGYVQVCDPVVETTVGKTTDISAQTSWWLEICRHRINEDKSTVFAKLGQRDVVLSQGECFKTSLKDVHLWQEPEDGKAVVYWQQCRNESRPKK